MAGFPGRAKLPTTRNWPFRYRLLVALSIALLPLGVLSLLNTASNISSYRQEREDRLLATAEANAASARALFNQSVQIVDTTAIASMLPRPDAARCREVFLRVLGQRSEFGNIALADRNGKFLCSALPVSGIRPIGESDYFTRARATGRPTMSPPMDDLVTGQRIVIITIPNLRPERADIQTAALVSLYEKDLMAALLPNAIGVSHVDDTRAGLVRIGTGDMVTGNAEPFVRAGVSEGALAFATSGASEQSFIYQDGWFKPALIYVPLGFDELAAVYMLPTGAWLPFRTLAEFLTLTLPILMWIAALFISNFLIVRMVGQPLVWVRRAVDQFAAGNRSVRAPESPSAAVEVRSVARSFNELARTLTDRERRLEDALDLQRTLSREVHHRVKNNLQIILSLLSLEVSRTADDSQKRLLQKLYQRVNTLSLAHHAAYQSDEIGLIDVAQLTHDIALALENSGHSEELTIRFNVRTDTAELTLDQAMPFALLVTELLAELRERGARLLQGEPAVIHLEVDKHQKEVRLRLRFAQLFESDARDGEFSLASQMAAGFLRQLGGQLAYDPERMAMTITVPDGTAVPVFTSGRG